MDIAKRAFGMAMLLAMMAAAKAYGQVVVNYTIVKDSKAIEIVGKNTASAEGAEIVYDNNLDSIKKTRTKLLTKTTIRNAVKTARNRQQTYLGDLRREGIAYRMLVRKCERLLESAEAMLDEAYRHPARVAYCSVLATRWILDAESAVHRCLKIAMRSSLGNPLEGIAERDMPTDEDGNVMDAGNDGYNLVYHDQRLMMLHETLSELGRLTLALDTIRYMLMTRYTWKDLIARADPYGYVMAQAIMDKSRTMERDLERLPFW